MDEKLEYYEIYIDLYKHHTELLLKFMAYYYAVTGAILSYYLSRPAKVIAFSLLLPLFLSTIYGFGFFYAARIVESQRDDLREIQVELGMRGRESGLLIAVLRTFGWLLILTAVGLVFLILAAITAPVSSSLRINS